MTNKVSIDFFHELLKAYSTIAMNAEAKKDPLNKPAHDERIQKVEDSIKRYIADYFTPKSTDSSLEDTEKPTDSSLEDTDLWKTIVERKQTFHVQFEMAHLRYKSKNSDAGFSAFRQILKNAYNSIKREHQSDKFCDDTDVQDIMLRLGVELPKQPQQQPELIKAPEPPPAPEPPQPTGENTRTTQHGVTTDLFSLTSKITEQAQGQGQGQGQEPDFEKHTMDLLVDALGKFATSLGGQQSNHTGDYQGSDLTESLDELIKQMTELISSLESREQRGISNDMQSLKTSATMFLGSLVVSKQKCLQRSQLPSQKSGVAFASGL